MGTFLRTKKESVLPRLGLLLTSFRKWQLVMSLRRVVMGLVGVGALWGQAQGVYLTGKEESQEGFGEGRDVGGGSD